MTEFNVPAAQEAVAAAYPDRDAIVQGACRRSAAELTERTRRLANFLRLRGLGLRRERSALGPSESGQDHVAVYLRDCPEYLETMFGAFKARVAPFNVNYRYVAAELSSLLADGQARGVVYHEVFTPMLAQVLPQVPGVELLIRVPDGSAHPLLPGAVDFEDAVAAGSAERPDLPWSPDDLYILYTGGTTGLPKGVLWRHGDILVTGMGVWDVRGAREWASMDELVAGAANPASPRTLTGPPLMHGAGQWAAFQAILNGGTAVLPTNTYHRDPADMLGNVEAEGVTSLVIVGDSFARPLIEEMRRHPYDLSRLRVLVNGGAPITPDAKAALVELLPHVTFIDTMGSSESGTQGRGRISSTVQYPPGCFRPTPGTVVVDEDREKVLSPGHDGTGWLASSGRIPLGYLGQPEATARAFPIIGGVRMAVAGDRARHRADGLVELLGRDSVTINSGGEKIFVEEVEAAILAEPGVLDVTVVGRPSDRWGSEVVAVVAGRPGHPVTAEEILATAGTRLARYKLPKQIVFVDRIQRSPAGKPDYRWAREVAIAALASVAEPPSGVR